MKSVLSKVSALVLLVGVIVSIVLTLVLPVQSHIADQQLRLASELMLLGRLRAVSAGRDAVAKYEVSARSRLEAVEILEGRTEGVQVANLQSRLTALAATSGGQLRTSRALTAKERDGIRLVGVELHVASTNDQMRDLLLSLETERLPLVIEGLQVTALPPRGSNSTFRLLDVRVQVFAPVPNQLP